MTNKAIITICYIDDDRAELDKLGSLLESTSQLQVKTSLPSSWLESRSEIQNQHFDLYLVDYELSKAISKSEIIDYSGNVLAAYIREVATDYPIVLLTKPSLIAPATRDEHLVDYPLLDDIIYKDEFETLQKTKTLINRLLQLALGYREIRQIAQSNSSWAGILDLLKAKPDERDWLALAQPPVHPSPSGVTWRTAPLARWIIRVLLEYPGILLDPLYAATSLQVSQEAFLGKEVQSLFEQARYEGVFADLTPGGHWWASRLEKIALEFTATTDYADHFEGIFYRKEGIALQPAKSIVTSDLPGNTVCYVLREPVRFEYSLAYRPDNRPAIMQPARISFKAIQERNDVPTEYIEDADEDYLNSIRKMQL